MLVRGTIKSKQKKAKLDADEDWDLLDEIKDKTAFYTKSHGCWKDLTTLLTIYCQGELNGPQFTGYKATNWPRLECKNYNHR
jgi:hypothetical protein